MSGWDVLYCDNHPDRIALERCEVCGKPLCAYCLYYTEDGQRLCNQHAEIARLNGVQIEEPAAYAEHLIGAQAGMVRKQKRSDDPNLYKGNSTDLYGFIGMLIGVLMVGAFCGATMCLPLVGFLLSLVAVLNARKAYDPRRTRRFGIAGLVLSGVWIVVLALCVVLVVAPMSIFNGTTTTGSGTVIIQPGGNPVITLAAPGQTGPAQTSTPTGTPTDTPEPTQVTTTPETAQ